MCVCVFFPPLWETHLSGGPASSVKALNSRDPDTAWNQAGCQRQERYCALCAWCLSRDVYHFFSKWTNEWKASLWLQKPSRSCLGYLSLLNLDPPPSLADSASLMLLDSLLCFPSLLLLSQSRQWTPLVRAPAVDCPLMVSVQPLQSLEAIWKCLLDYVSLLPETFQMVSHFDHDQTWPTRPSMMWLEPPPPNSISSLFSPTLWDPDTLLAFNIANPVCFCLSQSLCTCCSCFLECSSLLVNSFMSLLHKTLWSSSRRF